ncbi:unnamed protein product [Cyprideis torosa]|uniref:Uncharacterized protein n=1 Tax=Cyprideis torosa TaxID=163714 RepID=A0A7R8W5N3_9CRUS|nr:unnamed protein product [Cyprideis torosa]CAG0881641.1 unnamed protein product [Cyprideis torosa]
MHWATNRLDMSQDLKDLYAPAHSPPPLPTLRTIYFRIGDREEKAEFHSDTSPDEIKDLFRAAAEAGPYDIIKLYNAKGNIVNISPKLQSNSPDNCYRLQVVAAHCNGTIKNQLGVDVLALERRIESLERSLRFSFDTNQNPAVKRLQEKIDEFQRTLETVEHLSWLGFYKDIQLLCPGLGRRPFWNRVHYRRKSSEEKEKVFKKFLNISAAPSPLHFFYLKRCPLSPPLLLSQALPPLPSTSSVSSAAPSPLHFFCLKRCPLSPPLLLSQALPPLPSTSSVSSAAPSPLHFFCLKRCPLSPPLLLSQALPPLPSTSSVSSAAPSPLHFFCLKRCPLSPPLLLSQALPPLPSTSSVSSAAPSPLHFFCLKRCPLSPPLLLSQALPPLPSTSSVSSAAPSPLHFFCLKRCPLSPPLLLSQALPPLPSTSSVSSASPSPLNFFCLKRCPLSPPLLLSQALSPLPSTSSVSSAAPLHSERVKGGMENFSLSSSQ